MQVLWPLSSGLRSLTLVIHRPSIEITIEPAASSTTANRSYGEEEKGAGAVSAKGAVPGEGAAAPSMPRPASGKKAAMFSVSSLQAVILRWFQLTVIVKQAKATITAVRAEPTNPQ